MDRKILDLGAQDPELKNSPVAWESDEETDSLREQEPGAPECYFNGKAYEDGVVVKSGTVLLCCSSGIWLPVASSDPDNP
jgi:hypothetical protein